MKIADFEYSHERGELRRNGDLVALQGQPMRLLGLLLERPGEIVSRERIREVLWKQKHGDHEHGINTAVRKLRSALGPAEPNGLRIVTSAGEGYRLLLPATEGGLPPRPMPAIRVEPRRQQSSDPDPVGQEAFIHGRFLFAQRNPKALLAAEAHFKVACERMPNSPVAHASLSRTYRFLTIFEVSEPAPLWERAEQHALRAVELDAHLSEAQSSLACTLARFRWHWREGCAAYEQALELNPDDPETYCDYGVALLAMGQYDEGARILNRILELDPRYAVGRATVGLGWIMQGRQEEALALLTGMTNTMPDFLTSWIYLGIEQLNMEHWAAAEATFERTLALAPENPTFLSLLAQAYAGQGRRAAATEVAAKLTTLSRVRYVSPTARLIASMAAGDVAAALLAVECTVVERDANFALYRRMRALDPIRRSPQFEAALLSMNLSGA